MPPCRVDFAKALVADELWGWPVGLLDRLAELRQQAWNGSISIEEWRERDAAYRSGLPAFDKDEVQQFRDEWIDHWIDSSAEDTPEELGKQLTGRLAALTRPAPSDDELWDQLSEIHEALSERQTDRRLTEKYRARRDRISEWLTRPGSSIDPGTGLPWARIAEYRVTDDPGIGPVPQHVGAARQLAMANATADERQRAGMLADDGRDRKLAFAMADLNQDLMTWLPKLLLHAAADDEELRPLLSDLTHIWSDLRVQRLLIKETAREWPAPYDLSPGYGVDET